MNRCASTKKSDELRTSKKEKKKVDWLNLNEGWKGKDDTFIHLNSTE